MIVTIVGYKNDDDDDKVVDDHVDININIINRIFIGHAQQNGEQLNNLLKTLHGYYFR